MIWCNPLILLSLQSSICSSSTLGWLPAWQFPLHPQVADLARPTCVSCPLTPAPSSPGACFTAPQICNRDGPGGHQRPKVRKGEHDMVGIKGFPEESSCTLCWTSIALLGGVGGVSGRRTNTPHHTNLLSPSRNGGWEGGGKGAGEGPNYALPSGWYGTPWHYSREWG